MLTTLLFIAIIISYKTVTKGFAMLPSFSINPRMTPFSKTQLNVRLTSTRFYEDANDKNKRKKNYNYYEFDSNFNNHIRKEQTGLLNNAKLDNNETLYTLIWFDCENCKKLIDDLKNEGKKVLYINGGHYFFDETDETNNTPLFYKNDDLIATDLFTIYEELFFKNINEEQINENL